MRPPRGYTRLYGPPSTLGAAARLYAVIRQKFSYAVIRASTLGAAAAGADRRAALDELDAHEEPDPAHVAWPPAAESLRDSPHSNVLKDMYDCIWYYARLNGGCHLMT